MKTKEELLSKFNQNFGNRYAYFLEKPEYEEDEVITIHCNKHNLDFTQKINYHFRGRTQCPECLSEYQYNRRKTGKEWIDEFNELWGEDTWDYSLIDPSAHYRSTDYVDIICPIHGKFPKQMTEHKRKEKKGAGCPECSLLNRPPRLTTEEVLERLNLIYEGCDYEFPDFIPGKPNKKKSNDKITLRCKKHGDHKILLRACLNEHEGCPDCGNEIAANKHRKPWEKVVQDFNIIHNNYYDYSLGEKNYWDHSSIIDIICPVHGIFHKRVDVHYKSGCPECSEKISKLEFQVLNLLKEMNLPCKFQYKPDYLGRQSVDIFIESLNLAIEAQGGQHFFTVDWFGGEKGFKLTIERDKTKLKILSERGIDIIYFVDPFIEKSFSKIPKEYLQPNGYMGQTLIQSTKELYSKIKSLCISREIPFTQIKKFEEVQYRPLNFRTI